MIRMAADPVAESASKCCGLALWHKQFDDFKLILQFSNLFPE